MRIFVTAKPAAKHAKVEKRDETHLVVSVKEPSIRGGANRAIAAVLADHFGVAFTRVRLVFGTSARQKTFEIL